ncbi:MAG: hypothetical protein U9Q24_03210 [Candidatus Ratteibacteria bacterium]|nr:hypothetical protein [Candidatus Ratteibacteria bacterium]
MNKHTGPAGFKNIPVMLAVLAVIGLYWRWFLPGALTYGDWWYLSKGSMSDLTACLWGAGLGGYRILSLSSAPLVMFTGFLFRTFGWSFSIIERLTCYVPLIFFLIFSPWYLARTLGYRRVGTAVTIIVFNLNTYMFFITAVTNMALAVAVSPLALALFIRALQRAHFRYEFLFCAVFALEMVYDMRIAYITAMFCALYFVYYFTVSAAKGHYGFLKLGRQLFFMGLMTVLFHSYMLIPFLFGRASGASFVALPQGYDNAGWVRTLSYWNLLHVSGLQATGWGKSGIINPPHPQFLLLPILAFSVFLFSVRRHKRMLLFFGITALVFSFFAKGSKPPFGEVYIWFFRHFPGFFMFREPGKWWSPLALSYAALIGGLADYLISGDRIDRLLIRVKARLNISAPVTKLSLTAAALAGFFILFPVQPISTLHYLGNFVPQSVPEESGHLENFLHSQPNFFRTLWLPVPYRFGYSSGRHPALSGVNLAESFLLPLRFNNPADWPYISSYLGYSYSTFLLRLLSVKYVLVPSTPKKEPNLYYWYGKEPKYFDRLAEVTPGLKRVSFEGTSRLYEVPNPFPHFYVGSESAAFIGNEFGCLPIIGITELIKNNNVFLPGKQISGKNLKNINNFIFWDSCWRDLALELSPKTIIRESYGISSRLRSGRRITNRQKIELKAENAGKYEVYLDTIDLPERVIPRFDLEINEKIVTLGTRFRELNADRRYAKLGEVDIEAGRHEIGIARLSGVWVAGTKDIKLLLVEKKERQKSEEPIWEKINQPNVDLSYVLSKDKKFYLSRSGDYIIKMNISPVRVRKKDEIGVEFNFGTEGDLENWSFSPSKVTYNYSIVKDEVVISSLHSDEDKRKVKSEQMQPKNIKDEILVLSAYFDGDEIEDEFVQMQNKSIRVDLKKYPNLSLTYRVENPAIQTIEVVAGIDFDKDGQVNEYIRGIYPRRASIVWSDFNYDLYNKAKSTYPDKKHYELIYLEVYPHKIWGVDCGRPERKGKYRFWLKGLQFCRYSSEEFFQVVEDVLDIDLASEEEMEKWSFEDQPENYALKTYGEGLTMARPLAYLELSKSIDSIDLRQFPMIELDCKVEKINLQNIELIFGLDFNGDAAIDKNIFFDYLPGTAGWDKLRINAYQLIRNIQPDEQGYNLREIKLRLKGLTRLKEYYPFYFRRLRVYARSLLSRDDFILDRPLFKIDGKRVFFKSAFESEDNLENLWIEKRVHLEKGEQCLDKLEDDSFKVKRLIIEPEARSQKTGDRNEPEITFKKINSTKYQVKVNGARKPFWLVFNESFHGQWRLYLAHSSSLIAHSQFEEVVADYPKWGVKEEKYRMKFTPDDISYLFKKPLAAKHHLVNMYANGWYIDPKELNLPENFTLVLYFLPQSLFYIGLGISGLTFLGCVGCLVFWGAKKRSQNKMH